MPTQQDEWTAKSRFEESAYRQALLQPVSTETLIHISLRRAFFWSIAGFGALIILMLSQQLVAAFVTVAICTAAVAGDVLAINQLKRTARRQAQ